MATETNGEYQMLSRPLPPAPAADKHPLPLVCLTDLTVDEETKITKSLQQSFEDDSGKGPTALIQLWRPSNSALLQPFTDNTKYALRRLPGMICYVSLISTPNAKLGGELHPEELNSNEPDVPTVCTSLLAVEFRPLGYEGSTEETANVRVFAKRHAMGNGGSMEILLQNQQRVLGIREIIGQGQSSPYGHFFKRGLEVHDPSRAVFAPNHGAMIGQLVGHVVDLLYDDPKQVLGIISAIRPKDLNIFLLFPATENETQAMQNIIQWHVDRCVEELQKAYKEKKQQHGDSDDEPTASEGDNGGDSEEDDPDDSADDEVRVVTMITLLSMSPAGMSHSAINMKILVTLKKVKVATTLKKV
ncbi:hypothetical protein BDV06DRAFT_221574 [Aspergillus oleicola]